MYFLYKKCDSYYIKTKNGSPNLAFENTKTISFKFECEKRKMQVSLRILLFIVCVIVMEF